MGSPPSYREHTPGTPSQSGSAYAHHIQLDSAIAQQLLVLHHLMGHCMTNPCMLCCLLQLAEIQRADQLMGRLSRVAAAINLRTSDPLTESGHDPVVELRCAHTQADTAAVGHGHTYRLLISAHAYCMQLHPICICWCVQMLVRNTSLTCQHLRPVCWIATLCVAVLLPQALLWNCRKQPHPGLEGAAHTAVDHATAYKKIQPHDGLSCPSCTTAPACKPTESTASILYQQGAETASCCQHSCALAQLSQPNNTYVLTGLLRTCFAVWLQEALQRQSRPSADALGLNMDPFTDSMSDLDTLDLRLEYVAAMMQGVSACR